MAITYHAGRRLQGLSTDEASTSALSASDYTSSNFTTVGSTVAITSNSVVFSSTPTNADNGQYMQIDSLAESDTWSLNFKLNFSVHNTFDNVFLGFTNASSAWNTSNTYIRLQTQGGGYQRFVLGTRISGSNSESSSATNTALVNTDYWCTFSSDGSGTVTFKVWTNSGRTGTADTTLTKTYTGVGTMNYIQHRTYASGDPNVWTGTVSEITATTKPTLTVTGVKPTNVQAGSRFEETDTRKMYHYNEATLTLSLGQTVMSSSPQFNYHAVDIPSASDFIMNFDWTLTGNRDTPYVTLSSDTTAYGDPASGQKKFIMMYANNNGDLRLGARYNDGGASENDITGTGTDLASNVKSYFQLIKSGSSLNYSRYGSASDRTSQTNALQSIATYTLPSTYTSTADFSYLGLGAYSSNGQNTIHEVKLYVGVSSTDTAWTEEGT